MQRTININLAAMRFLLSEQGINIISPQKWVLYNVRKASSVSFEKARNSLRNHGNTGVDQKLEQVPSESHEFLRSLLSQQCFSFRIQNTIKRSQTYIQADWEKGENYHTKYSVMVRIEYSFLSRSWYKCEDIQSDSGIQSKTPRWRHT